MNKNPMNRMNRTLLTDLYELTMAHSFITSFDEEVDAFRAFAKAFPDDTVLLIDTYDTVGGSRKAVTVAKEIADQGIG